MNQVERELMSIRNNIELVLNMITYRQESRHLPKDVAIEFIQNELKEAMERADRAMNMIDAQDPLNA